MASAEPLPNLKLDLNGKLPPKCFHCGKMDASKMCSRCRLARFCDEECLKQAWKGHKVLCAMAKDPYSAVLMILLRDMGETSSQEVYKEMLDNNCNTVCNACDAVGASQRCPTCRQVYFCNGDCYRQFFPIHKKDCRPADKLPVITRRGVMFKKGLRHESDHACERAIRPFLRALNDATLLAHILPHVCFMLGCMAAATEHPCTYRLEFDLVPLYAHRRFTKGEEIDACLRVCQAGPMPLEDPHAFDALQGLTAEPREGEKDPQDSTAATKPTFKRASIPKNGGRGLCHGSEKSPHQSLLLWSLARWSYETMVKAAGNSLGRQSVLWFGFPVSDEIRQEIFQAQLKAEAALPDAEGTLCSAIKTFDRLNAAMLEDALGENRWGLRTVRHMLSRFGNSDNVAESDLGW